MSDLLGALIFGLMSALTYLILTGCDRLMENRK